MSCQDALLWRLPHWYVGDFVVLELEPNLSSRSPRQEGRLASFRYHVRFCFVANNLAG